MGIGISHPERRIYPDTNLTKLDVARYFEAVSSVMLPHIARRPLALVRCPDGVGPACFFQKHAAIGMPAAIRETTIRGENVLYVDSPEGLVALVQHGVLEVHVWGSRLDSVEQPDWIVMDFDPDPTVTWDRVVQAAIDMRTFMADLGLESFVKTTGGKGLHVVVPIRPALEWDAVKRFTHTVAEHFAAHAPDQFTTNMAKRKRTGRMFVDYLRNGRGATAIAPYSTRARPGSLIATPISWEELESGARPQDFTIASVPKRIGRGFKDPWAKIYKTRQGITATILKKLGAT
jgi:bifunctional non-homologous end joining protein LigD